MAATNFSLTFNDSLTASVSDETVLNDKLTENTDYSTQKTSCLVYNEMGEMTYSQFHNFFNDSDTRLSYISQITTKLGKDYETGQGKLGAIMLAKYNLDEELTGINKKENISWTVDLAGFNTAIQNSSVVDEFVSTPANAIEKNHLQIIFKFNCNGNEYKVGVEWIMKDA